MLFCHPCCVQMPHRTHLRNKHAWQIDRQTVEQTEAKQLRRYQDSQDLLISKWKQAKIPSTSTYVKEIRMPYRRLIRPKKIQRSPPPRNNSITRMTRDRSKEAKLSIDQRSYCYIVSVTKHIRLRLRSSSITRRVPA